jgi:cell division protein FtsN
MARGASKRAGGEGWLSTLLGVVVLTVGGFLVGLVAGVVSEEPELVVGHVSGESREVGWAEEALPQVAVADSAATDADSAAMDADRTERPSPLAVSAPPPPAEKDAASAGEPAARTGASASDGFAIQVGAFAENASAQDLAASLRHKGFPAAVHGGSGDGRWRVRVGPLASAEEAQRMAVKLKSEERLPTWVLPEGGR